jgi:hypothetical protein
LARRVDQHTVIRRSGKPQCTDGGYDLASVSCLKFQKIGKTWGGGMGTTEFLNFFGNMTSTPPPDCPLSGTEAP